MPLCTIRLQGGRPIIELHVAQDNLVLPAMRARGEVPAPRPVRLLVDTGADMTKISEWVLTSLGLFPVGTVREYTAFTADEPVERDVYSVQLSMAGVANGVLAWDLEVTASRGMASLRVDGLLGRDILNRCHLFFNGPEGHFSLAFEPPPEPI